jgi:acetyl esterase/lipase
MHSRFTVAVVVLGAGLGLAFLIGLAMTSSSGVGGGGPKLDRPYLEVRYAYRTDLTEKVRAPEQIGAVPPPAGASEIVYSSGDLQLKAWFALPPDAPADGIPAIVYLHGGFALGHEDFKHCKPFLDAGYAVLLPSLRGENDNHGQFELLYGEVDDARAATQWLGRQERIAKGRIFAFGHSVGGGLAALLSLWDDVPLRDTGSSGGLYPYTIFAAWSDMLPFNRRVPLERQLRLLLGNTGDMKHPHRAYIGTDDELKSVIGPAEQELATTHAPLTITLVEGDHMTSLPRAIRQFIKDIEARR